MIAPSALAQHAPEQTHFSAEDEAVQHPVPMPPTIWAILQKDEYIAKVLADEKISAERAPTSWFSVAEIHLHNSAEVDYIIEANPPLSGANITTFWVFIPAATGMKLAFTVGAHDLIFQARRFNGYKIIEASAENCCTINSSRFRFNRNEYVEFSGTTENIK